ncbi:hypothetical protein K502DRAFT_348362 [Neoconidiobolus thromboides FSU 785]|nr:hypothetical protein K502DRAFT_348362 [Neoconidiobolus thromboides FSU 785]
MKLLSLLSLLSFGVVVLSATIPTENAVGQLEVNNDSTSPPSATNSDNKITNKAFDYPNPVLPSYFYDTGFFDYIKNLVEKTKKDKENDLGSYIGKKLVKKGGYQYYVNSKNVYEARLPEPYRIITPDNPAVTLDYRQDRLNIVVDEDNIVTRAYYG